MTSEISLAKEREWAAALDDVVDDIRELGAVLYTCLSDMKSERSSRLTIVKVCFGLSVIELVFAIRLQ